MSLLDWLVRSACTHMAGRGVAVAIALSMSSCAASPLPVPEQGAPSSPRRPQTSERETRTAAQRKINSRLLFEIYRRRGIAEEKGVPPGETGITLDPQGRAQVDVRAPVTPALQKKLVALGATIVSTSIEYRSVVAWLPLLRLEELADDETVMAIEPAAERTTNPPFRQ